jgi:osmotically-inducible protein OsmY
MMKLQKAIIYLFIPLLLTGCLSAVFSGASMAYDHRALSLKASDYFTGLKVRKLIYETPALKCGACAIDIAVFHGDILIAGVVPEEFQRQQAFDKTKVLKNYRRLFFQIGLGEKRVNDVQDTVITTSIRAQILSDPDLPPDDYKVLTVNGIVYLLGDTTHEQAEHVIGYARNTAGVVRVVKLFKYYEFLEDRKKA